MYPRLIIPRRVAKITHLTLLWPKSRGRCNLYLSRPSPRLRVHLRAYPCWFLSSARAAPVRIDKNATQCVHWDSRGCGQFNSKQQLSLFLSLLLFFISLLMWRTLFSLVYYTGAIYRTDLHWFARSFDIEARRVVSS